MSNIRSVTNAARMLAKRPFRVSIEGNIGSGKSTCIKFFDKYPNVEKHPVSNLFLITISLNKSLRNLSLQLVSELFNNKLSYLQLINSSSHYVFSDKVSFIQLGLVHNSVFAMHVTWILSYWNKLRFHLYV